ncbi:uracil-DNA glycosylase [Tumidithrix elongata RA019]|uniref:Type-4 uracil-DNA glycosylase n=1 Tax=Tumidithrix elongata BACA0141 TaxID=2716417 RepID=A0AAW9PX34_9CYAN|nr:uracil-DNA glycosylase [Tumidithrix elongata RA019]
MTDAEQISLFDLDPSPKAKQTAKQSSKAAKPAPPVPVGVTYADLDALKADAIACQKCPLAATRTNVVVERGNRQALIAIIGEGPGQNEDETGLPFVGKAGQLLDKILQSVDLDPEKDVYICNVVKCRPPNNRVPEDIEMAACKPYLLEQIRLIDPKIILLTGATAVKAVTGDKRGITKIRGEWGEWEGRLIMPILHPAYLLRNASREKGSPKWLMWQDIQTVKAKYLEIKSQLQGQDNIEEDEEEF